MSNPKNPRKLPIIQEGSLHRIATTVKLYQEFEGLGQSEFEKKYGQKDSKSLEAVCYQKYYQAKKEDQRFGIVRDAKTGEAKKLADYLKVELGEDTQITQIKSIKPFYWEEWGFVEDAERRDWSESVQTKEGRWYSNFIPDTSSKDPKDKKKPFVRYTFALDFSRVTFGDLEKDRYKSMSQLINSYFESTVTFIRSTFESIANFSSATFEDGAYFSSATFEDGAYFGSATFEGWTDFSDTTFDIEIDFTSVTFKSQVDFINSYFGKSVTSFGSLNLLGAKLIFSNYDHNRKIQTDNQEKTLGKIFREGITSFSIQKMSGEASIHFDYCDFHLFYDRDQTLKSLRELKNSKGQAVVTFGNNCEPKPYSHSISIPSKYKEYYSFIEDFSILFKRYAKVNHIPDISVTINSVQNGFEIVFESSIEAGLEDKIRGIQANLIQFLSNPEVFKKEMASWSNEDQASIHGSLNALNTQVSYCKNNNNFLDFLGRIFGRNFKHLCFGKQEINIYSLGSDSKFYKFNGRVGSVTGEAKDSTFNNNLKS